MAIGVGRRGGGSNIGVGIFLASGADVTPAQFSFSALFGVEPGSVDRGRAEILDVDSGVALTATNGRLSNDGGQTWATSVSHVPGQTFVESDELTAGAFGVLVSANPTTVNGVSAIYQKTSRDAITTPDAPIFASITDALTDTTYTRSATITGMDVGETLAASGTGLELSNDGVNWLTSLAFSVTTQARITVTTGADAGTAYTASGSLNGIAVSLTATTATAYARSGRHMVYRG